MGTAQSEIQSSLPRIFKGRRGLTGRRRSRGALQGAGPYLGANPFQGALPFTKKRELSPGSPPASPGSFALPHRAPPARGCVRLRSEGSGIWTRSPFDRLRATEAIARPFGTAGRGGPAVRRPLQGAGGIPPRPATNPAFTFIAPRGFDAPPGLAHVLDSLVRVSRRVGWVADPHRGPRAPAVGGTPAAERRAVVGDALGTVRTGLRTRRGAGHPGPATAAGDAFPRTPPKSGAGAVAVSLPRSQGGRTPSHQGPVGGTKPPARRPHGDPGRPKNRSRRTTSAEEVRRAPAGSTEHRGPLGAHGPPRAAGSMATVNPFIRHQRPALERHG
ncbi:unnamed protein product [Lampetra planeri]